MRILTAAQMKKAEQLVVDQGGSFAQLMENAGQAAAQEICRMQAAQNAVNKSKLITGKIPEYLSRSGGAASQTPPAALLLCGKGNNAGDAFVVGRLLAEHGWNVQWAELCGKAYSPLASENLGRLPASVKKISVANLLKNKLAFPPQFIIDGVFGTGFRGTLPEQVQQVFAFVNTLPATRIALDIPSGLDCDTSEYSPNSFVARYTLAFGALKPALIDPQAEHLCGQVLCLDIGV